MAEVLVVLAVYNVFVTVFALAYAGHPFTRLSRARRRARKTRDLFIAHAMDQGCDEGTARALYERQRDIAFRLRMDQFKREVNHG